MKNISHIFVLLLTLLLASPATFASNSPAAPSFQQILAHMEAEATRNGIPAAAVKAVIKNESAWKPGAVSKAGAMGLMQLMPDTAKRFGVSNPFDPYQNITGGTRYLAWLLNRFGGNWQHTFAGYNAGEGRIDQYGGIPPYAETQNYVNNVMHDFQLYSRWGGEPIPPLMQPIPVRATTRGRQAPRAMPPNAYLTAATAPTTVQWQPPVDYYQ